MAKSVMILGMGRFGASVAHTLFQMGYDVLGIDTDEKVVQENVGKITFSVQGDSTNESTPVSYTHLRAHETEADLV